MVFKGNKIDPKLKVSYINMNFFQFISQDWAANKGNTKGRTIAFLFRIANFCNKNKIYKFIGIPYLIAYKIVVELLLGIEIPWNINVGSGFSVYHGQASVINSHVSIGRNCVLRHCTTIGNKKLKDGTYSINPIIGDNVDIGSNVCIIGPITIGNNVKIGCGTVVIKSVPDNCIVVGNPGIIK